MKTFIPVKTLREVKIRFLNGATYFYTYHPESKIVTGVFTDKEGYYNAYFSGTVKEGLEPWDWEKCLESLVHDEDKGKIKITDWK